MKLSIVLGLLLGLLSTSVATHSYANCPPGWSQIASSSEHFYPCTPDPDRSQQQAALPPLWGDRWGAIATDEPHGIFGSVTGMLSQSLAEQGAMIACKGKGGTNCIPQLAYVNGCAALVVGPKVFTVAADTTVDKAVERGRKAVCSVENTDCHVHFSACSPPVRLR